MDEIKNQKSDIALREEAILKFWQKNDIFKKTLEKESPKGNFVFYEGPPTANAKPALHHLESRAFKDIIPRYKTMRGFSVPRKAGWDTHGLPVELQIEKKLGLTSKKDIEKYGIEQFNKECKESVFEYISDWEKFTDRIGYWVDKKSAYYTFDTSYIESVWNILKTINEKNLLYKDYKVLPWCPRCGTALSSHELAQGYQDDKDLSVYAKFKVVEDERFFRVFGKNRETQKFFTSPTYLIAWTTTPWTLPGNVALAVGNDIIYVEAKIGNEILVLAKERISVLTEPYEIVAEHKGSEMVGMEYEPLYPFMSQKFGDLPAQAGKNPDAFTNSYKVYSADFVTTTDGTGIVHTAVMYGQEDFELGTKLGLPKFHLVKEDGHFFDDMDFLSGRFVKDEEVAVDLIKNLAHRGLLFKKEKYEHSYPHCWRCKTALIYYARDSWYIKMSSLRDKLVSENEGINWEPEYIKEGRFGEWLREIKDWAISRERYWGTPLPIWESESGEKIIIGSLDELKKYTKKSNNSYFAMRHGQAENNTECIVNAIVDAPYHLTEKGRNQVLSAAETLKESNIDVIYCSPFIRTKETAEIVARALGFPVEKIQYDDRLEEFHFGEFSGKPFQEFLDFSETNMKNFFDKIPGGESYQDSKNRVGAFLQEVDRIHSGKNILIVGHGVTLEVLPAILDGLDAQKSQIVLETRDHQNAEIFKFSFTPLPYNKNYELDLHRPYIDSVELVDEKGNTLKRVKEVMDVWFDSGAMPFAQDHFPFEKESISYPADFISEAIDQTRGWFYTLHAIGILMGKGKAYKNVICLGHILDTQGKKMSKSVGNIVDPWVVMNKYGVDALRLWMYTVNSPGDSKNFDEKTVDEIVKKVFNPAQNILAFYEMYKDEETKPHDTSVHVLDRWILSRLNELVTSGTKSLDKFQVFESARGIRDFMNDFSTWYIRRSRDRFKSDDWQIKNDALGTTSFVLVELMKYMAPFTPFFSESVYQKIKTDSMPESVHLCNWPVALSIDEELLLDMERVRAIVSSALELRQKSGHKVRQPLAKLTIGENLEQNLLDIIADEINVKEVVLGKELAIDTVLTEKLVEEGIVRDIIRGVQDARKTENLSPSDTIKLVICADSKVQSILNSNSEMLQNPTQVSTISYSQQEGKYKVAIEGYVVSLSIVK